MPSKTTVALGGNQCKPFQLQVKVFSPESGYRFSIEIQKQCDSKNQPIWALIFTLDKKIGATFTNLISVNFTAGNTTDAAKIATIAETGMTLAQFRAAKEKLYPLAKSVGESGKPPTPAQQDDLHKAGSDTLNAVPK